MLNPIIVVNLISLLFQTSTNVSEKVTEHLSQEDLSIIEANSIAYRSSYDKYLSKTNRKKESDTGLSISNAVSNPYMWLKLDYLDYHWALDKENSASTSDVSNAVPIEMKGTLFPNKDIAKAITLAGIEDKTNYGGCGPIAEIGVLDYFARYLNYNEIIDDPTNGDKRVGLAKDVFSNAHFSFLETKAKHWFGLGTQGMRLIKRFKKKDLKIRLLPMIPGLYSVGRKMIIGRQQLKTQMKEFPSLSSLEKNVEMEILRNITLIYTDMKLGSDLKMEEWKS